MSWSHNDPAGEPRVGHRVAGALPSAQAGFQHAGLRFKRILSPPMLCIPTAIRLVHTTIPGWGWSTQCPWASGHGLHCSHPGSSPATGLTICFLPFVYTAPPSISLCLTLATWLFLNTLSSFQCGACANATSVPVTVLTCSSPSQALRSCRPHLQWPLRASSPSTHLTEACTPSQALT